MKAASFAILLVLIISCAAQRSPYAGRGYGYPSLGATEAPLVQRIGAGGTPTTTMRLPIEALGNAQLVKQSMKLPVDQQPYWLLNWQALEGARFRPKTYNLRRNGYIDSY